MPKPAAELPSETIVRKRMVAEPVVDVTPADTPEPQPSKANRLVLWLAGSAAVLIAAGVAVSLMVTGLPGPAETEPVVPGNGGAAVVEQIPTPVLVSATSDGATVTFAVANPDANDWDSMIWRRTDRGDSEPTHQVSDGVFTADGPTACVEVHIIRSGRESANPLESCYPHDLDSTNGVYVTAPGDTEAEVVPGTPALVEHGATVSFGEYTVVIERS